MDKARRKPGADNMGTIRARAMTSDTVSNDHSDSRHALTGTLNIYQPGSHPPSSAGCASEWSAIPVLSAAHPSSAVAFWLPLSPKPELSPIPVSLTTALGQRLTV
ncbi:unnamed protein product [Aspergillus oryzae var. brunneus]|uniref:Unnamed protein product n=2 Tax=Aspergillus oryzae TaxID=5062 RepID=A0AAN5BS88_ASPOZ|nr:unnamed protein product [Aspergillus oryzae]GMG22606.1 unnamed protein product [Aspergillus oryzae]GMG46904.1 unnamed protein product [Aspergillus oryzae var. brunneus]